MSWDDIDKRVSKEELAKAQKRKDNKDQDIKDLSRAYTRLFQSDDGKKIINDLTNNFIYNNDVPFDSKNINYESAYKNGEGGAIKYILTQIARVI